MRIRLLCLALSCSFILGCSDSSDQSFAPNNNGTGSTLLLLHDVGQEAGPTSGVNPAIDSLTATFLDVAGNPIGQPQTVDDGVAGLPAQTRVLVPAGATHVQLQYHDEAAVQARQLVGDTTLPVPASGVLQLLGNPVAPVHFADNGNGFDLIVHDQKLFLKGVGFDYTLGGDSPDPTNTQWFSYIDPDIANSGANVIRTYGVGWNFQDAQGQANNISAMLKYASDNSTAQKPIMVLAGLVYDTGQGDMNTLIPQTTALVQNDPNYDHLLGWAIGNENGVADYPGINSVITTVKAQMTADSLVRPVTHAVPTVSSGQVAVIQQNLPALDWLGINTFYGQFDSAHQGGGFLNGQAQNLVDGGWKLPWGITEYYSYDLPAEPFGNNPGMPNQIMNGQRYFLELNSTLNAANYRQSYEDYIASPTALTAGSIGGFVLNWGPPHNSKLIAFWKMVYVYRGEFKPFVNPPYSLSGFDKLACAYEVASLYGGSLGEAPPQIVLPPDGDPQGIQCNFKATLTTNPTTVAKGAQLTASVTATGTGPLTFDWYLVGGSSAGFSGDINAPQTDPQNFIGVTTIRLGAGTSTTSSDQVTNTLNFNAPSMAATGNNYQLRVVVRNKTGGAATAAVGFPM